MKETTTPGIVPLVSDSELASLRLATVESPWQQAPAMAEGESMATRMGVPKDLIVRLLNERSRLLGEEHRLRTELNKIRDSACARSDHKHIDTLRKAAVRLVCPTNGGNHPHGFIDDQGKLSGTCQCGVHWHEACEAARLISESKR